MKFSHIDADSVVKIIDNLKPKSSFGLDGISSNLLKSIKHCIAQPLSIVINQCFDSCEFPDCLKIARVIPVYKKDDKHSFSNYRPISLFSSFSKIFEKILFNQMFAFLKENEILFPSQYGFRAEHSTEHAVAELTDRIYEASYHHKIPLALFLDLSKAFDTLNHDVLLWKLSQYGFRQDSLMLLNSYLHGRFQFVDFTSTNGYWCPTRQYTRSLALYLIYE